jgi:hypothetical protein
LSPKSQVNSLPLDVSFLKEVEVCSKKLFSEEKENSAFGCGVSD